MQITLINIVHILIKNYIIDLSFSLINYFYFCFVTIVYLIFNFLQLFTFLIILLQLVSVLVLGFARSRENIYGDLNKQLVEIDNEKISFTFSKYYIKYSLTMYFCHYYIINSFVNNQFNY